MVQEEFHIHDFIENYEEYDNPDIQWKTSSREEFLELKGSKREKRPEIGKFFKHQDLFFRYLLVHDRIFNIHETGTGKTGSIINFTENYQKYMKKKYRKIFVLQPGPPTVDDFKDQIVKFSKDPDFEKLKDITDEKTYKNNMTRIINKNYEVTTYQKFIKDDKNVDEMNEYYDDCVFFLDEAHKLRNLTDSSSGSSVSDAQTTMIYNYIWKVFHTAKRIKVIIATATPMINEINDFVPLLNLLLPENKQFPTIKDESFYQSLSLKQLEPYFRGMFTYVRFLENEIRVVEKGDIAEKYFHSIKYGDNNTEEEIKPISKKIINNTIVMDKGMDKYEISKNQPKNKTKIKKIPSQIVIKTLEMKQLQLKVFEKVEKLKKDSFYRKALQSSVFVFPNGDYGTEGFNKFVRRDEFGDFKFKNPVFIDKRNLSLEQFISSDPSKYKNNISNISKMGCKFAYYIEKELSQSEKPRPGNSFCYLEMVEGSGVVLLGLIMEKFGFENFKSNEIGVINKKTNKINTSFQKRKRFAMLTGKTNNMRNILNIFNHPDNIDGEYIQIIIASEVARDGINLRNVLRGYILSPGWHESGMHQALSRFIRATSHEDLKTRHLLESKNPNTSYKVNVDVYRLAAVKPGEEISKETTFSIDLRNYIEAERKDIENKKILRFMKQCAFDAYLNYDRNIRESDIPFSKETDYTDKYMKIWKARGPPNNTRRVGLALNQGPGEEDTVYNTYNIRYSSERESSILKEISELIPLNNNYYNFEKLVSVIKKKYPNFRNYEIYNIIYKNISENRLVEDLRRTSSFYLQMVGDSLVLGKNISEENKTEIDTENEQVFISPVETFVELDLLEDTQKLYSKLESKTQSQIIDYYTLEQNYVEFKYLLEDILIKYKQGEKSNFINNIMQLFGNYFLISKKPENWIKTAKDSLSDAGDRKQGRKRAEGSTAGFKTLDLDKVKPGYSDETVFIHFYRESDKTGFSITSILEGKVRKIRVMEEDFFRDTDTAEQFVYTYMFDKMYEKILENYKKSKYYGSYIYRGGEQIDDIVKRKREFFRIIDTSNPRNKGIVCTSIGIEKIQQILKIVDKKKEYKQYYSGKFGKGKICEIIKDIFKKNNLLFISL
tara:strand:+ start:10098 stop:13445 length:3348 start_codon:yes stop_codon:yes gene_type:complete